VSAEPEVRDGWVARELAVEFPALRVAWVAVDAPRSSRSPRELRERMRLLADRFRGPRALTMRREPVPAAYRAFFRQVGMDPDVQRTPAEAAALERLMEGGVRPRGALADALALAVLETGVPVWALDDARVDGPLGLRDAQAGERLGEGELAADLPAGRVVVADAARAVAVLFGDIARSHLPRRATTRLRLFTVAVPGVPALHVEEALLQCADALGSHHAEH
jgi:DNA/RNA-binding domain of Phe-tRNA-synthetase-like protein